MAGISGYRAGYWNHIDTIVWIMYRKPSLLKGHSNIAAAKQLARKSKFLETVSLREAKFDLLNRLSSGDVTAFELSSTGNGVKEISPAAWSSLDLHEGQMQKLPHFYEDDRPYAADPNDPDNRLHPQSKKIYFVIGKSNIVDIWKNKPSSTPRAESIARTELRNVNLQNCADKIAQQRAIEGKDITKRGIAKILNNQSEFSDMSVENISRIIKKPATLKKGEVNP